MNSILERVWKTLISLRLAVLVIVGLAVSLATATILESQYDTATAQYLVYRSKWFYVLLSCLGLNILAVAISRLPWTKKHTPFLMAHAGIIMILVGSGLTATLGVDGSIRISEGEVTSAVELDEDLLLFKKGETTSTEPFPWMPAFVAEKFQPKEYPKYGLKVLKFISDAEAKMQFVPSTDPTQKPAPAIQIKILGAPMGGAPELWLWAGDPAWSSQRLGPARFLIRREENKDLGTKSGEGEEKAEPEARIDFVVSKNGDLRYEATSIRGEKKSGKLVIQEHAEDPTIINPEWRMPIRVQVKKFVVSSINQTEYVPMKVKPSGMGNPLPNPAIQVALTKNSNSKLWLGLGDRAEFTDVDGTSISMGYYPKRMILPFALRLKRFELKHNPGTMDPSAYSSFVQVVEGFQKTEADMDALPVTHISMNEPLKAKQYTFYQASYIPDMPRPTTTVLSVNYDPGRALKYWGSILLIMGAVSLYLAKVIRKKPAEQEA